MPEATLSSKYQVTLPMDIVRALKLKGGDKLIVHLSDDHVIIMPKPENWATWAKGRLKGVYGTTPEEVDRYVRELRSGRSPEEEEAREQLENLLARTTMARQVLQSIRERGSASYANLHRGYGRNTGKLFEDVLGEMEKSGAIKRIKDKGDTIYRLTQLGREISGYYPTRQAEQ